jgi:hypothetical protein
MESVAETALVEHLVAALVDPDLEGPLAAAAYAAARALLGPSPDDSRFLPGCIVEVYYPSARNGEYAPGDPVDVLDPEGRPLPGYPPPGIWDVPPEVRAMGLTPATAPAEVVTMPAWIALAPALLPAELDDPVRIADRWQAAASYVRQGVEMARRHRSAAVSLPVAVRSQDRRRLETRVEGLGAWVALYGTYAPAVLASLGPFLDLLHAVAETGTLPPAGPAPILFRN